MIPIGLILKLGNSLYKYIADEIDLNKASKAKDELILRQESILIFLKNIILDLSGKNADSVQKKTPINSLGLDSIQLVTLIILLEEKYCVEIRINDTLKVYNVNDLIKIVIDAKGDEIP